MSSVPPGFSSNVCYRHPDRQSFVLCQRCGRTICGECQTPAAVGVVCPECMKEQRASAPRTRPRILSRSSDRPVVTLSIIAVTALVFVLQLVTGGWVTQQLWFAGAYVIPEYAIVNGFQPWRMLTTMFVHSTGFIFHVALNMYTLWIFGQALESLLGRGRFLALYLIAGFGGSLGVLALSDPLSPVVGASGAIFGLMGAFIVIQRRLGGNMTGLLVLVGINLVIGFIPGINVAWQAHLGGLVVGGIAGLIFVSTRQIRRKGLQVGLLAGLSAALLALTAVVAFIR
ncbi:membrane associated rhomboid family serine protease [Labedella gwakjiensis]|uniref:Membrane associated rhomboid family serine protease n=1 Tax=Labedella gwakjiensis TaxID=390269 RepID=A0A2P8GVN1_9MICO|nr:rhomboid family intramembrane serine protease [Labedella gwakjiensis]PSL38013.1 membrane associated rhomboid family serine protease [Labedella gwakjiensis]RUQ87424.1 rhomboid family intramembrane serine protease [Labedella gwakjiensis]